MQKYKTIIIMVIGGLLLALSLVLFYAADSGKNFGIEFLSDIDALYLYIAATLSLIIGIVLYYIPLVKRIKNKTMI